jgi:hypothetical protein
MAAEGDGAGKLPPKSRRDPDLLCRICQVGASLSIGRPAIHLSIGEIEPYAAVTILDLDNPNIGIKRDFAVKPLVGLAGRDPFLLVRPDEGSFDAPFRFGRRGLRGRLVQGGTPVETVDPDENRARFRGAPAAEHRALAFRPASAQIGRDPYVRPEAHPVSAFGFARPRRAA